MNSIDLAIIIIMGISCIIGLIRGFTREILGLLTWLGAASATYFTVPQVGGFTRGHIANPMIADGITACALFIIYLILFSIISGTIANRVRESNLGGVDRSLGFAFGIIRGVVVLCAAEIGLSAFVARPNQAGVIQAAQFTPLVRRGADNLVTYLPTKIGEMIVTQAEKAVESATQVAKEHIEQQTTKSLEGMNQILPDMLPEASQDHKLPPQSTAPAPSLKQSSVHTSKAPEEDPEKTMESLAQLKPQVTKRKSSDGDYDKRQKRDMDRLIQTTQ